MRRVLYLLIPLLGCIHAAAQSNIAPAAKVQHHDTRQSGGGVGVNSAHNYNDGFIGAYPGVFTGYVNPGGFIEFEWPNQQSFNRVVTYNGARALEDATIEYWDGNAWQTAAGFRSSAPETDSVTFQTVTTTKLRLSRISNAAREPVDFREIVIRQVAERGCSGTGVGGTVWPASQDLCMGEDALLVAGDYSFGGTYQWQVNAGGGWTDIPGATQSWYRFRVTSATPVNGRYRLKVTCGTEGYSSEAAVNVQGGHNAVFAALPYAEDFETTPWQDACGTGDVPSGSWTSDNVPGKYKWAASNTRNSKFGPFPTPVSGKAAARFYSFQAKEETEPRYSGNLDLHVNCSAQPGGHRLEFYYANPESPKQPTPGNDYLMVYVSTDGGQTYEPVGGWEDQQEWNKKMVTFSSGSPNTIIRFTGYSRAMPGATEATDLGIDGVEVKAVDPCSGTPPVPTAEGPASLCAGQFAELTAGNIDQIPGISLQWQQSLTGSAPWTDVSGGTGATTPAYRTQILYDTIWYRMQVTCAISSGVSASQPVAVRVHSPVYASLPFMESFEEWTRRCDTYNDVPSESWIGTPAQGDNSWRRNDEGNEPWGALYTWNPATQQNDRFYNWSASYGKYPDPAFHGNHSARFHTYGSRGQKGALDLFIDCSTHPGDKELSFALNLTKDRPANVNNPNPAPDGYDYLIVYLSTDGGSTFAQLERIEGPAFSTWEIKTLTVPSVSANTVIRFEATSVTGYKDMGLDYVRMLPGCTGEPLAGVINYDKPCADADFFLKLEGVSQAGGLTYQWQRSPDGVSWINMPGTGSGIYTTRITAATWFRTIVSCPASGAADTTPVAFVELAPFYYCYCESRLNSERTLNFNYNLIHCGKNIGNVTIRNQAGDTLFMNGDYKDWFNYPETDLTGYSDFRKQVVPARLYQDSSYEFDIHSIHSASVGSKPVKWAAYIDFNQDGIYDTLNERIWMDLNKNTDTRPAQGSGVPYDTYGFRIPANAKTGVTGMRVVLLGGSCVNMDDWRAGPVPCGEYGDGETEDYLVEIFHPECDGAPAAGTTSVSQDKHCPGYTVTASNTTHEYGKNNMSWDWQYATDGGQWTDIAGSEGKDTVTHTLAGNTRFRLRITCANTGDVSYSNEAGVTMKEPYQCYCYSEATGGNADSSDAGLISVNGRTFGAPGPHLNNTAAVYGRTDNTDQVIEVDKASGISLSLIHILNTPRHGDAKITVFIDYNNDLKYDVPDELVWSAITSASSWNISAELQIPENVVLEKPTGMRVVLNNDVQPNVPSDEACGSYISGETEDFVLIFREEDNTLVGTNAPANGSLEVYPNPASGRVYVQYSGQPDGRTVISVLSLAGQVLLQKELDQSRNGIAELDLGGMADGVYYIRFSTDSGYMTRKLTLLGR